MSAAHNVTNVTEPDNVTNVQIAEVADYAARKGLTYIQALQAVMERGLVELNWSNPHYVTCPTLPDRVGAAFGMEGGVA